jgi:peptide subunit release factor 1 (eRF1)
MALDFVPHIYELVALKDTYHRYVVLISAESHARIGEVNVGSVTKELWTERAELRKRAGREWAKEHYQSHRRNQTQKFINEKIEILDRLFAKGAHTHLVLAGNPRTVARVRKSLPKRLRERVIDVVPAPGNAPTTDVVAATLSTYADYEQTDSLGTAGLFLDELKTGGLAVAGTEATLKALARGQVDILLLSEAYDATAGWKCRKCDAVGVTAAAEGCPRCGARAMARLDLKEEITRSAERLGCTVEIVRGSDVMFAVGGVGCLLRHMMSEQRT